MKLYAISDLHLPGAMNKSMDAFGENWKGHMDQIRSNWQKIDKNDVIFIPGDLSWAMDLIGAEPDLRYLSSLPGKKFLVKGNHDYCFGSINKSKNHLISLDNDLSSIRLIYRDSHVINYKNLDIGITGTRGWSNARNVDYGNGKIINRELANLKFSLDSLSLKNVDDIIVMTHFPPTNLITEYFIPLDTKEEGNELIYYELYEDRFFELIKGYNVSSIIFGHIHNIKISKEIKIENIKLYCASADAINFNPIEIVLS